MNYYKDNCNQVNPLDCVLQAGEIPKGPIAKIARSGKSIHGLFRITSVVNSDRTTMSAAPFFPSVTSRLPLQQPRCQNLNSRCSAALPSRWTGLNVQVTLAFGISQ